MDTFKDKILPDFRKHISLTQKRRLTNVQYIVEFYFWLTGLDKYFEPFSRHVAPAKQIDDYFKGILPDAFRYIWRAEDYFVSKNLHWKLETAVRYIPQITTEDNDAFDLDAHEREKTRKILEQYGRHKQKSNKSKDAPEEDFDL